MLGSAKAAKVNSQVISIFVGAADKDSLRQWNNGWFLVIFTCQCLWVWLLLLPLRCVRRAAFFLLFEGGPGWLLLLLPLLWWYRADLVLEVGPNVVAIGKWWLMGMREGRVRNRSPRRRVWPGIFRINEIGFVFASSTLQIDFAAVRAARVLV